MSVEDYVWVVNPPYTFTADGGELQNALTPEMFNTYTAEISGEDAVWLSVDITQPSDNRSMFFTVRCENNPLAASRTATIKFTGVDANGIVRYYYFEVIQEAAEKKITFTPASPYTLPYSEGNYTISANANFRGGRYDVYNVYGNDELNEWADVSVATSNMQRAIIQVSPTTNISADKRSGNMYVQYADYEVLYKLEQYGNPNEGYIEFEKTEIYTPSLNNNLFYNNFTAVGVSGLTVTADSILQAQIQGNRVIFLPKGNYTDVDKDYEVILTGTKTNGEEVSASFLVYQQKYDFHPVCEDVLYNFYNEDGDDYIDYRIDEHQSKRIVYNGRAYQLPDVDGININLNRILYPNLNSNVPSMFTDGTEIIKMPDYLHNYDLYLNNNKIGYYSFFNDYNYDFDFVLDRANENGWVHQSSPIRKKLDSRQYFFYTVMKPSNEGGKWSYLNYKKTLKSGISSTITASTNTVSAYTVRDNNLGRYKEIDVDGEKFEIIDTCYEYCLYYKNAKGGWDSFLIQGNNKQTDKITSYKYMRNYNNTIVDFESKKYLNIINEQYRLYTDYLKDDEAKKMYNILESNEVYLHHLPSGKIMAVNITNSNCEYKTYSNEGKKKFYYTIDVEASAEKVRR